MNGYVLAAAIFFGAAVMYALMKADVAGRCLARWAHSRDAEWHVHAQWCQCGRKTHLLRRGPLGALLCTRCCPPGGAG